MNLRVVGCPLGFQEDTSETKLVFWDTFWGFRELGNLLVSGRVIRKPKGILGYVFGYLFGYPIAFEGRMSC